MFYEKSTKLPIKCIVLYTNIYLKNNLALLSTFVVVMDSQANKVLCKNVTVPV